MSCEFHHDRTAATLCPFRKVTLHGVLSPTGPFYSRKRQTRENPRCDPTTIANLDLSRIREKRRPDSTDAAMLRKDHLQNRTGLLTFASLHARLRTASDAQCVAALLTLEAIAVLRLADGSRRGTADSMPVPRSFTRGSAGALNSKDFKHNNALQLFSPADQCPPLFRVWRSDHVAFED
jgi:hypothetical protein